MYDMWKDSGMIDPAQLVSALASGFIPLPGKCIIEWDTIPTMAGLIHIPQTAQRRGLEVRGKSVSGDVAAPGRVLAMTPTRSRTTGELLLEDFKTGDRVWVMLLASDMDKKVVCTLNTRVYAVLENGLS